MITYKQDSLLGHDILFRLWGSVLPYAWFRATFSASVCFFLLYYNAFESVAGGGLMYHPNPFTFYFQIAALVLAFHTNQAYNRFWEARTQLQSMAAYWGDAAAHVLAFDRCKGAPQELLCPGFIEEAEDPPRRTEDYSAFIRRVAWQAKMVHLFSLLHAVSLSYLLNSKKDNVEIEVLGGVSRAEHHELAVTNDHSYLVSYWITESLTSEHVIAGKGLVVPAALLSRTYQLANNGMIAYNQLLHVMNWTVILITPVVMACWISGLALACIFTWIAVGAFHSLFAAAGLMESPFGTRPNDLPLIQLNSEFIKRLIAIVTPNVAKYLEEAGQMHVSESISRSPSTDPHRVWKADGLWEDKSRHSVIQVSGKTVHLTPHLGVSSSQLPSSSVPQDFECMFSPNVSASDVSAHVPFDTPPHPLPPTRSNFSVSSVSSGSARQIKTPKLSTWTMPQVKGLWPVSLTTNDSRLGFPSEESDGSSQSAAGGGGRAIESVRNYGSASSTQRKRAACVSSTSSAASRLDAYPHVLQQVNMDATCKRRLAATSELATASHQKTVLARAKVDRQGND
eukprot:Lankesteria_metandrocarpae@DN5363_c0_g1_i8.p1